METTIIKKEKPLTKHNKKSIEIFRLNRGGINLTYKTDKNGNKILLTLIH